MPTRPSLLFTAAIGASMIALTMTGCGGAAAGAGPSSSVSPAPQPTATETPAPEPAPVAMSLAETADSAGCAGYERASELAPFAAEWGKCTFEGGTVRAYHFATPEDYAGFLESVSGFGIVEGQMAVAGAFVFAPDDQTQLDAIRAALHI